jgi:hypothetical protein
MILLMIGTRRIYLPWRTISFLVFDICGSNVFLKTELFSLVRASTLPRNLFHTLTTQRYPCVLLCVRWFSTRVLRFWHLWYTLSYSWSCVIHLLSDSSSILWQIFDSLQLPLYSYFVKEWSISKFKTLYLHRSRLTILFRNKHTLVVC